MLNHLLDCLLANDNDVRRAAEEEFAKVKQLQPQKLLVESLAILENDANVGHRAMMAVLLRGITLGEESTFTTCEVLSVAALSRLREWPELLQRLPHYLHSSDATTQCMGYYLLNKLAEYIGSYLSEHLSSLWSIMNPQLSNAGTSLDVSCHAVLAFLSILHEVSIDESSQSHSILCDGMNAVCGVLSRCMQDEKEESMEDIFTSLSGLFSVYPAYVKPVWPQLLQIVTAVSKSDSFRDSLRCLALELGVDIVTSDNDYCRGDDTQSAMLYHCLTLLYQGHGFDEEVVRDVSRPNLDEGLGDEEGSDNDIAEYAARCLERLFATCLPEVVLKTCHEALQFMCGQMIHFIIGCMRHNSPRIQYCAIRCTMSLLAADTPEEEEEEWEDMDAEEEEEAVNANFGFRSTYGEVYLPLLCDIIQSHFNLPRVVYAAVCALRAFGDPQMCSEESVSGHAQHIFDIAWSILETNGYPTFVLEEVASAVGNFSIVCPSIFLSNSDRFMTKMKQIVASDLQHINSNDAGLLKGKCLECIAIMGRSLGLERFYGDAILIMDQLVAAHERGLDFGDPLTTYIIQSCARIAGVLEDRFEPYVSRLLPPLLAHIQEELKLDVLTEAEAANVDDGDGADNVFSIYKRGVGDVKVVCNSYQIIEREMSCRALYQYLMDIPQMVYMYAPDIIAAVASISTALTTENMSLVTGSLISDSLKLYLRYTALSPETSVAVNAMTEVALTSLHASMHRWQNAASRVVETVQIAVDSIRETLKVLSDYSGTRGWKIEIPFHLAHALLIALRDEAVIWVNRNYVEAKSIVRQETVQVEEDLWIGISDAIGWLLKVHHSDQFGNAFVNDLAPFLQGLLNSRDESASNLPLISMAITVFVDAVEGIDGLFSQKICSSILPFLYAHMNAMEFVIPCVYGIGVCAAHGGEGFRGSAEQCINILSQILEQRADVYPVLNKITEEEASRLRDNALSSLLKIAIYHPNAQSNIIIQTCLGCLPLQSDVYEARDIHKLLLVLYWQGHRGLLGENGENLKAVMVVVSQLLSVYHQIQIQVSNAHVSPKEFDEFWDTQIVHWNMDELLHNIETAVPPNIPKSALEQAIKSLPKDVKKLWSKLN